MAGKERSDFRVRYFSEPSITPLPMAGVSDAIMPDQAQDKLIAVSKEMSSSIFSLSTLCRFRCLDITIG
jgi:hypothetical protein